MGLTNKIHYEHNHSQPILHLNAINAYIKHQRHKKKICNRNSTSFARNRTHSSWSNLVNKIPPKISSIAPKCPQIGKHKSTAHDDGWLNRELWWGWWMMDELVSGSAMVRGSAMMNWVGSEKDDELTRMMDDGQWTNGLGFEDGWWCVGWRWMNSAWASTMVRELWWRWWGGWWINKSESLICFEKGKEWNGRGKKKEIIFQREEEKK